MLRSSVTFRISCHSEISWEVRRWLIRNKRELSKASCSILNSALLPIELYYFNMNTEKSKLKGLSEIRFGSMIFLLRMAGISFQMKKVSIVYAIYMITVIICSSTTYLGMFADVYLHWYDLDSPWRQCVCWFRSRIWCGYFRTAGKKYQWLSLLQYYKCYKHLSQIYDRSCALKGNLSLHISTNYFYSVHQILKDLIFIYKI